ncbi:MAG: hypothetical protein HYY24_30390 [Verrucomicrobia bacterium]|nr:hypothetical protein [Verrucomicrobiota bacterium]
MSEEPKKPIEQELEACARRRRLEAGAPLELHSATRRMLQAEIARTYGPPAKARDPRQSWLSGLWPRLALAGPAFAALVVVGVIWWSATEPPPEEARVAEVERLVKLSGDKSLPQKDVLSEGAERSAETSQLALAAPTQPSERSYPDEGKLAREGQATEMPRPTVQPTASAEARPLARQPAPTAGAKAASGREAAQKPLSLAAAGQEPRSESRFGIALPPADSLAKSVPEAPSVRLSLGANRAAGKTEVPALAAEAEVATATVPAVTLSPRTSPTEARKQVNALGQTARGVQAEGTATQVARFYQNTAVPANSSAVLNSFQVQQTGEQLRFIDADGSTYLGRLVETASATAAKASEPRKLASRRDSKAPGSLPAPRAKKALSPQANQAGATYNFIAQGTNRSLNQLVVFQGNYRAEPGLQAVPSGGALQLNFDSYGGTGVGGSPGGRGFGGGGQQPFPAIQGQAVVGGTSTIPINAVPSRQQVQPQR